VLSFLVLPCPRSGVPSPNHMVAMRCPVALSIGSGLVHGCDCSANTTGQLAGMAARTFVKGEGLANEAARGWRMGRGGEAVVRACEEALVALELALLP